MTLQSRAVSVQRVARMSVIALVFVEVLPLCALRAEPAERGNRADGVLGHTAACISPTSAAPACMVVASTR
jgi:hypothetical protein